MRRDFRKKHQNDKAIIYGTIGVLVLLLMVFALLMYANSSDGGMKNGEINSGEIASIVENKSDVESASSSIGKTVQEEKKIEENKQETPKNETTNIVANATKENSNKVKTNNANTITKSSVSQVNATNKPVSKNIEKKAEEVKEKKQISLQMPVEGEITNQFAKENLIYSETLQEWVTHTGIDIKAEKTSIVQSAEDGTVKSIKNDPRYGLTIVIDHGEGFETVYANLLSSEFVTEGEKVIKGQSIGTIGNTAVFESADEPHLHFEVLKDSVQVDPSIYVK